LAERRGSNSARPAFSRNRLANSAVSASCSVTRSSISSGAGSRSIRSGSVLAVRQAQHDAVVGVHHLDLEALAALQLPLQGHGPGGVDARAEGGQDADAPVAQFVPKRSMTMVRSSGTWPVASRCSWM
jgi:hypothetical protein